MISELPEYLASKVMAVETGCWLWTACVNRSGYGVVGVPKQRRTALAHRQVWEEMVGPIPDGLVTDHLCRVRSCVNPDHIELVTPAVNNGRDRMVSHHALKTHCPQGHEYTDENTYRWNGKRICRTCSLEAGRKYRMEHIDEVRRKNRERKRRIRAEVVVDK